MAVFNDAVSPFLITPSLAFVPGETPAGIRLGPGSVDGVAYMIPVDYPAAIVVDQGLTKILVAANLADLMSSPGFTGERLGVFSGGRLLERFTIRPAASPGDPALPPAADPPATGVSFVDYMHLAGGQGTNRISFDSDAILQLPVGQLALFVQDGGRLWLALGADAEKLLAGEVPLPASASFIAFVTPVPARLPTIYAGPPADYDPSQYVSLLYLGHSFVVPADTLLLYLSDYSSVDYPKIIVGAEAQAVLDGAAQIYSNTTYQIGRTPAAPVACFAAGTAIATPDGPRAVEKLAPGDLVLSPWGEALQIIWTGHRRIDCSRHPNPAAVWPVRVRAHAFGAGMPARDVRLSPDHAVFVAPPGSRPVLIPIRHLVNGVSVVQEREASVTYWHVELERHGVLLAEGLPAESYLDTGNRGAFVEAEGEVMLHPDFAAGIWNAKACAPHVSQGVLLDAVRRRLGFARRADTAAAAPRLARPA